MGAAASMVITHYPELIQSKKVVLTRGDILDPKQVPAEEVCTPDLGPDSEL